MAVYEQIKLNFMRQNVCNEENVKVKAVLVFSHLSKFSIPSFSDLRLYVGFNLISAKPSSKS